MAKRVDREYVPVLIDVDKNKEAPAEYGVTAMPTLVITNAKGEELARSVGAPFTTPEAAIEWFDEIGGKIDNYAKLQTAWDESKHTDAKAGEEFAEAAVDLGKFDAGVEVYKKLVEVAGEDKAKAGASHAKLAGLYVGRMDFRKGDLASAKAHSDKADEMLPAEGDTRIDSDIVRAKILMYEEDKEGVRKLTDKHYGPLVEAKDERAIDLAEIVLGTDESEDREAIFKRARTMYLKLAEVFSEHERVWELKTYAAWYGLNSGSKEEAMKELEDIAENGEGRWKDVAKQVVESQKEEEEEGAED